MNNASFFVCVIFSPNKTLNKPNSIISVLYNSIFKRNNKNCSIANANFYEIALK